VSTDGEAKREPTQPAGKITELLGVRTNEELVQYATERGLIAP
jgi:hypothetical protein